MKSYDRTLLQTSLEVRVAFMRDFIGFSEADAATLNGAAPLVAPLIKIIVDNVYAHLFEYDYTKKVFLKRNAGFEGDLAESLEALTLDNPQIAFRKKFLNLYVEKVFKGDYEKHPTWEYLDKVGLMHTGVPGFKHRANKEPLSVDLLPCTMLLGWVQDVVISTVLGLDEATLPLASKTAVVRAFGKIMWIQQDLFQRHYIKTDEQMAAAAKAELEREKA